MNERGRLQDWATLVPIAAAIMLLPPIIEFFDNGITESGIPKLAVYIFVLWIGLVLISHRLAGLLIRDDAHSAADSVDATKPDNLSRSDHA